MIEIPRVIIPSDTIKKISQAKRIVVKVGTNVLMGGSGNVNKVPDISLLDSLSFQISELKQEGKEIILVSSGSIGFGAAELELQPPIVDIPTRQACAAVGQPLLMQAYKKVFQHYNIHCAQLLLTGNDFNSETSYVALKNCIELLLEKGVVPIINENDSVSIDEIGLVFGDNDNLSAMLATKINAELLVILTDVDGLYDSNPKKHKEAKKISYIKDISDYMKNNVPKETPEGTPKETPEDDSENNTNVKNTGSILGTGGMRTKLQASALASTYGCMTIITLATYPDVLCDISKGTINGTIIV